MIRQVRLDWSRGRFSTRLIVGYVLLALVTTLSAGLPAYWLTRRQLEAQSWASVAGAQRATLSLITATHTRLDELILLFAERPTLRTLLSRHSQGELDRRELELYIDAFKQQSDLDLLLVCDGAGAPLAGDPVLRACPPSGTARLALLNEQPVILASRQVSALPGNEPQALAVAGLWLDEPFLRGLAAATGVEQSLLTADGTPLVSSIPALKAQAPLDKPASTTGQSASGRQSLLVDGAPYYALMTPLTNPDGGVELVSQVALPVAGHRQAERRALAILILSTGAIALLATLLGVAYIRRLTQPLQQLTETAEAIAVGHLAAPSPIVEGPQEVATLSRALAAGQRSLLVALAERSQARDWLAALIQSIVEGVITYDGDGCITFFSQGAETISGWTSAEAIGRSLDDLFQPAQPEAGAFRHHLPMPGQRRRIEVLHRSGRVMTLSITGAQLAPPASSNDQSNEQGAPAQNALVIRDVTGEEALSQMHSYYLANLTHEFQTPLSTLNASLELLMEAADELSPDELRALLRPAHLSLVGLQTLVNNLMATSAIEAGQFTIRLRPTNLNQIIDDALRLVRPLFERRNQSFMLDESGALVEIQADPARLTLALVNLMSNASKYSPNGAHIDLAVDLVTEPAEEQDSEWLRIAVADRGPGIPPEARARIFNRFFRLGAPEADSYGAGIGLFVVKTTVEAHGGRVGLDDRPGGGMVFWMELPVRPPKEQYDDSDRRRRPGALRRSRLHTAPRRLRGRAGL